MGDEGKAGAGLREQAIDWLVALDCGTVDEQAFDAWRNADPRHAAAFAQAAAAWRRTADPRLSALLDQPPDTRQPIVSESDPVPQRTVSRRAVTGGAIAALLGLGGGGAFLAWPRRAFAETAVGERRTVRLPDGSHAMLNTDTRIAWRFDEGREFWLERGEAALLVQAAEQPFRVYSDPIDARLSEGRFSLRLEPTGGQLMVLAGRAAAAYRGTLAETIHAGSALTISGGSARLDALSSDMIAAATAWQSGRIVFNGMPLDRAIAEFNRYLPDKIVLQQPDLATTRLGGEFRIDDPDNFLLALREGFDIDHRRQGDRILLFRRRT
ncbi:FecR domain-containing protein [Sphingomonas oligophenolica]|uniref:FecR domain-containing protein n=1 Tax=Sphingomonas oligophenolica TaxID=301154 RepID=A0ABU9Y566_9SPHN